MHVYGSGDIGLFAMYAMLAKEDHFPRRRRCGHSHADASLCPG
jgi:hypothetical protein